MKTYKADATGNYKNDCAALDQLKQRGFECGIDVGGLWFLTEPDQLWRAKNVLSEYGLEVVEETTAKLLAMDRFNEDSNTFEYIKGGLRVVETNHGHYTIKRTFDHSGELVETEKTFRLF